MPLVRSVTYLHLSLLYPNLDYYHISNSLQRMTQRSPVTIMIKCPEHQNPYCVYRNLGDWLGIWIRNIQNITTYDLICT